jgi:hypothetical protein
MFGRAERLSTARRVDPAGVFHYNYAEGFDRQRDNRLMEMEQARRSGSKLGGYVSRVCETERVLPDILITIPPPGVEHA